MSGKDFFLVKITSVANEKIKEIESLHLKKYRNEENKFLAEGVRLVEELVQSDFHVEDILVTHEAQKNPRVEKIITSSKHKHAKIYEITPQISSKLSKTKTPQGIFAVAQKKKYSLQNIKGENAMLVVLDGVQNPLNVGTIIRTAEAAGASAVILLNSADLYGDKTLRGTMGSAFHLPIIEDLLEAELFAFLEGKNFRLYATSLDKNSRPYCEENYTGNVAFIFGSEAHGVSSLAKEKSLSLHIPMAGKAESLNVSAAAAVILFEAFKERSKDIFSRA